MNLKTRIHIDPKLTENSKLKIMKFIIEIKAYRDQNEFDLNEIVNMNKVSLFLNMVKAKIIVNIGVKKADTKTYDQEKIRVTAILSIVADDTKLPQILIFSGHPNRLIAKEIQKIPLAEDKQIRSNFNKKTWNT